MLKQDFTDCPIKDSEKKEYIKPCLTNYGDVRDITLGTSGFGFESGATGNTRCDPPIPVTCGT